ncbi:MAG: hypothetical protein SFX72_16995 [Isosphaeraceae bacterium]|nr:hypothetical protein [Isosphaeraceae bacterium]
MLSRVRSSLVSCAALLALLAGCGGETAISINTDVDSRKVSDVVDEFNEARTDAKNSERLFVKDALPKGDAFKKYAKYSFAATGSASISGETASMEVSIQDETSGSDAGKLEWTFKKEGDAWKLEKAPLP